MADLGVLGTLVSRWWGLSGAVGREGKEGRGRRGGDKEGGTYVYDHFLRFVVTVPRIFIFLGFCKQFMASASSSISRAQVGWWLGRVFIVSGTDWSVTVIIIEVKILRSVFPPMWVWCRVTLYTALQLTP